jgi:hypothetical protein
VKVPLHVSNSLPKSQTQIWNEDAMSDGDYHIGQRLSLKGELCTIRYIGPVSDKAGEWLGVEWDDAHRGKHDGTHNEVKYFKCESKSPAIRQASL